jgi:hypothetical protein
MAGVDIRRLIAFALVCLAISLAVTAGTAWLARHSVWAPLVRWSGPLALYAVSVALCGVAGGVLEMWSHKSIAINFLASLICFAVPFALMAAGPRVSCFRWWECLP